jgi:hypothetical protein
VTAHAGMRLARRFFAGPNRGSRHPLRAQRRAFDRASTLVYVFYACNLFYAFRNLRLWRGYLEASALDALWPVAWVEAVGVAPALHGIMAIALAGAFAAALLPHRRVARVLAFVGLLLFHAFINSFGKINHSFHGWVLVAFLLVFLPDGRHDALARSVALRQRFLNAFWSAQALVLLIYSMAGGWKLLASIPQIARGEVHCFAPQALSLHIAQRLLQTDSQSLLGPFFVEHPLLGWPAFLLTLYLQTFALWIAFRPSLQRIWAAFLIAFHFMVYLTMSVSFAPQVLLVALLLLVSPFAPEGVDWKRCAAELPMIGRIAERALGLLRPVREPRQPQQALDGPLGSHRVGEL